MPYCYNLSHNHNELKSFLLTQEIRNHGHFKPQAWARGSVLKLVEPLYSKQEYIFYTHFYFSIFIAETF